MKNFSVKGVLGTIKRRPTGSPNTSNDPQGETPEAIAARSIRAFIEAGGAENAGDEVTFLPAIVDAAESSPAAAAECARLIRKYLHKDYWSRPSYQYNAIMVMRILADNPGMTFTRNADKKFVETCKELLRTGRDPSVRQMLMETLDSFEQGKEYDEGLTPLVDMWKKEKEKAYKAYGGRPGQSNRNGSGGGNALPGGGPQQQQQQYNAHSQNYFSRSHSNRRLPDPVELANRLEEARTSAKLLTQVVQCTPPSEVLSNDLIREFADRCLSASRSIQGYMNARDPGPDNDTMESMIDTNEQLQQALNLHQRAVLNAKKTLGINSERNSPSPPMGPPPPPVNGATRPGGSGSAALPPPPLPAREGKGKGTAAEDTGLGLLAGLSIGGGGGGSSSAAAGSAAGLAGPSRSTNGTPGPEEDPFRDPQPESSRSSSRARPPGGGSGGGGAAGSSSGGWDEAEQKVMMPFEPFHPGGFDAKPAYARRQESAVNNLTMRGAAEGGSALEAHEGGGSSGAAAAAAAGRSRADSTYDDDRDDDDEAGGSKSKQPMYRY